MNKPDKYKLLLNNEHIKDNGEGFNIENKDKLFCLFQRLHHSDNFEGSGIGLAVVKKFIFKYGGKIWADGKIKEGATFFFTLPLDIQ